LPATLELTYDDGSKQDVRVPWETWMQHHNYVIHVDGTRKLKSATIDPARALPDSNRANNTFTMR
ncbi:MAG: Ig-like domain-containing protein, partial [Rhodanobacter sp.]